MLEPAAEPLTLLQVVPALDTGGVEQTTLDVARAVVQAGGRALVASSGGRLEAELAARGGELIRLPMASKNPLQIYANGRRVTEIIQRERVGVVHARSRAPAYSAWMAARRTGAAFVTTYHGVYNAQSAPKRLYNRVMARGDIVIANSAYTRDHLLAEHLGIDPQRVVAIPRGVDLGRFSLQAVSDERIEAVRASWGLRADETRTIVLLAGRLTAWKGQALLIKALARLEAEKRDRILLVLAGDDQGRRMYRAELEAAAHALGGDAVRITGHCADMPAAYLCADFAAAPSLQPEAFGRTAVEPQAMGRPVLAADHGAARETVLDGVCGWRVRPGDAGAWAHALATALDTPRAMRRIMGEAGRERVERLFSLQAMTRATLQVYQRALAERRR